MILNFTDIIVKEKSDITLK